MMRFYNNAAKIFGTEDVLCRRLENLEGKMVYTTRGMCSIYRASHLSVFFEKKFSRAEDCAEGCAEDCAKSQLFFNVCCSAKPFAVRRYFCNLLCFSFGRVNSMYPSSKAGLMYVFRKYVRYFIPIKACNVSRSTSPSMRSTRVLMAWDLLSISWALSWAVIGKVMRIKLPVNLKQSSPYARKRRGMPKFLFNIKFWGQFSFIFYAVGFCHTNYYCT